MSYRAAVRFADLQDGRYMYNAGDTFPRDGLTVTEARLAELAGSDNRAGYPLIMAVPDPAPEPAREPAPEAKSRGRKRVKRNDA